LSQKELAFPIFVIPGPVAGHGIEINGNNYLIPVDAVLERDIDAFDEAIPLDRILTVIEPTKQLRLVILDACRDNPFNKTMKRTIATRRRRELARLAICIPRKYCRGLQYLRLEWKHGCNGSQAINGMSRRARQVLDDLKCRCAPAVP
jgi:hypothetical protein